MMRLQSSLFVLALAAPGAVLAAPVATPAALSSASRAAADAFFAEPSLSETRAVIVFQNGARVYERYAPGYGPGNRFVSWSMAKSITSTLVGELVSDGKLALDLPAPVPAWTTTPGDPRAKITLRQLLNMESGLRHIESDPPEDADTNRGLFSDKSADIAGYAVTAQLAYPPGTHWQYSTLTTHILADIVARTIAPEAKTADQKRRAMRAFITERLAGPAAMPSLLCEFDAAGNLLGGSLCHATARDWANFGQLYLINGLVAGREVVSPSWVNFVRTPAPHNPGYGGQFWLNRPQPQGEPAALFPEMGPPDAYAAIGHLGQYVVIVPSKGLVVVRLGKTQDDVLGPVKPALGRLVNSFPPITPAKTAP
jgi:CubicO group peptidase (beta-lactamase class C family)